MSVCLFCNSELPPRAVKTGRERQYCNPGCRYLAFKRRKRAAKAGSAFVTGAAGAVVKQADTIMQAEEIVLAGSNPETLLCA